MARKKKEENTHHLFLQFIYTHKAIYKKRHNLLCIKYFHFLPSKSICLPQAVCTSRLKWTVCVVCREHDKVDSGHFLKGRWKFMEVRSLPPCSGPEGIPVLKYSSVLSKKNKEFDFKWSNPSCGLPLRTMISSMPEWKVRPTKMALNMGMWIFLKLKNM